MNDEAPIPRSETDSWDANREVREDLQALLAELGFFDEDEETSNE